MLLARSSPSRPRSSRPTPISGSASRWTAGARSAGGASRTWPPPRRPALPQRPGVSTSTRPTAASTSATAQLGTARHGRRPRRGRRRHSQRQRQLPARRQRGPDRHRRRRQGRRLRVKAHSLRPASNEDEDVLETLAPYGAKEAFADRREVRRSRRNGHHVDARTLGHGVELRAVLPVAVTGRSRVLGEPGSGLHQGGMSRRKSWISKR